MGYTGGTTQNPTYHQLGDHSETVQVDFDPRVISYPELLAAFFASHDASRSSFSRQYMSAIFFHTEEQERMAREAAARQAAEVGRALQTQILPAATFYPAEDYHQKYALQGDTALMAEFRRMYPVFQDIVDSTAATRVNAYLYGCGTLQQLQRELDGLGLSEEATARLTRRLQ